MRTMLGRVVNLVDVDGMDGWFMLSRITPATDVVGCRSAVHDMALVEAVSTAVKALRCGPVSMFFANLAALGSHTHTLTHLSKPS